MEQNKGIGWIGTSDNIDSNYSNYSELLYFKNTFKLDETENNFTINITADSKYKLYINNNFVNVGPQKGDNKISYYDRLHLSPFVKIGNNEVLVIVLTIPDRQNGGNYSFSRTRTPGLYITGNKLVFTDSSWLWKKAPVEIIQEDSHFAPLSIFECAEGIDISDFNNWSSVKVYDPFHLTYKLRPENLKKRTIPLMKVKDKTFVELHCIRKSLFTVKDWNSFLQDGKSINIPANTTEIIEISAGEETTGYIQLLMNNGKGSKITILTSECYAFEPIEGLNGPILHRKGDRTDNINGKLYGFTDKYTVSGFGSENISESYEPFWYRTFRFIQLKIETLNDPLTLKSFTYRKNEYPLNVKTSVETSDKTLEKVWDISERTLRLCMHETYEDCPFYEQLQYAMDTRSQILYTYAISADDRLARQAMDDFRRSIRHDGMINCSYPNYENAVIPGFGIFYIAMVYDHMMYFGDKKFIMENIPAILNVLNFFRKSIDATGLVGKIGGILFESPFWSFIDWTEQWRNTIGVPPAIKKGPLTMESFYFVMALQQSSSIFEYIDSITLSTNLTKEAENLQSTINSLCRGRNGMYKDGPNTEDYSQHCQVFAILTGTVDSKTGRKYLIETLSNKKRYAQCSVAMMFYLYRALEKCDLYEKTNELWDIWRDMIKKNLTTCEEDSVLSRSDCHAWGALILYELPSVILGVRPTAPGFKEIEIKPNPGYLTWAKGDIVTPKGIVSISWEKTDKGIKIKSSLPEGIKEK